MFDLLNIIMLVLFCLMDVMLLMMLIQLCTRPRQAKPFPWFFVPLFIGTLFETAATYLGDFSSAPFHRLFAEICRLLGAVGVGLSLLHTWKPAMRTFAANGDLLPTFSKALRGHRLERPGPAVGEIVNPR